MPSSIPPPLDEPLNTYFAAQLKTAEQPIHVAEAVLNAAKDASILFRRLEVLDIITIGAARFVRMRTEIVNPFPIFDRLYSEGRGVISSKHGGEYVALLVGGREGKVSNLLMHASPKLGQSRMFRGTRIKHWERQFEAA